MLKKFVFTVFLLNTLTLFATPLDIPEIIDMRQIPKHDGTQTRFDYWHLGQSAFNSAPEIGLVLTYLKKYYPMDVAVETGTLFGSTTAYLSLLFDEVHTIEISDKYYPSAKKNLGKCENVQIHKGSSEDVMKELLPQLAGKRALFYLDAHWNEFWPLLYEIEEISKTHYDNCIIMIDDFKVPGRKDLPYDSYGPHECSYEYIREKLEKVYSGYTIHYIVPKSHFARAKFVAIPNKWK